MAKRTRATFGLTAVEIRSHRMVQLNPQHPVHDYGAVSEAFVGEDQLVDNNGQPVERVGATEDEAEGAVIRVLEQLLGPQPN